MQYVDGVLTADRFVQEIDDEIQRVKMIKGEAVGYMTYEMKISQNIFKSLRHFDDITFKTAYLRPFMQLFRNKTIDNSQGGSLYGDGGQK